MITFETFFDEKVLTDSKSWVKSKSPFATSISYHIELKISPLEYLCDHKSSSKHRAIIPFALEDRYDPKQSPECQKCVSKTFSTNFFRASNFDEPFTKTLFLEVNHAILHQNRKITTRGPL